MLENSESTVIVNAYAKINLFLEITGKRSDGYHTIESVMHKISLHDTVRISCRPRTDENIFVICDLPELDRIGKSNLAYKAAIVFSSEFEKKTGKKCGGITVKIDKKIPLAAGMAGGSADAAAVLRGLNQLFGFPLSQLQLFDIGAGLGADIPFCLSDSAMLCLGIGDELHSCHRLPECKIVTVIGDEKKRSTGAMYEELDLIKNKNKHKNRMCQALENGNMNEICSALYNAFEFINPHAEIIRSKLLACGASGALLSGSGPSVFGIFTSDSEADSAAKKLKKSGYRTFLCTPCVC